MAKEKKIVFSEEIDSSISGFSLGIALVVVVLFIWYGGLFHSRVIEGIVTILSLVIGIFGTFFEIEKVSHKNIKGISDLICGIFFSCVSVTLIIIYDKIFLNIFCILFLLFGLYGLIRGVLEIGYSLKIQRKKSENKKVEIFKIITGVTEVLALIVVILQLITELK